MGRGGRGDLVQNRGKGQFSGNSNREGKEKPVVQWPLARGKEKHGSPPTGVKSEKWGDVNVS